MNNFLSKPNMPEIKKKLKICNNLELFISFLSTTGVGDNINIMKTTFELNFDSYQAFKQHEYTKIWKQRKAVNLKIFTLITCKLVK